MTLNLNQTLAWKKSLEAKDPSAAAELAMLNDLQGNILKGHGRHHTSNIFIAFDRNRQTEARHFLASVGHDVTTALDQLTGAEAHRKSGLDAGTFVGVMLSANGYGALGCGSVPGDSAFAAGMASRTLNDPPAGDWDSTLKDVHAMILVATSDGPWRDSERAAMIARIGATNGAVQLRGTIDGNAIFNSDGRGIEHFGYVDGRSQPLPLQEDVDHEAANGGITIWNPAIPLGQVLVRDPGGQLEVSCGSYFVFRKLEQNVKGFKQREDELADHLDQEAAGNPGHKPVGERAGASVVGRFENGTPVTLDEDEVPLATQSDDAVRNNFDYRDDQDGLRCPFAGHIRKSNPRSDTGKDSIDSKTHLMARRGIPYGARTDGPNDGLIDNKPTGGVGLLFMAYQADLGAQFEFTQSSWVNNPDFARPLVTPGPETGIDPVIGQAQGGAGLAGQLYPVEWNERLSKCPFDFSGFVTMRGGEYFFAPSISFLKALQDSGRSTTSVANLMDRLRSGASTESA